MDVGVDFVPTAAAGLRGVSGEAVVVGTRA